MLTEDQNKEIVDFWDTNAHSMGFAVMDMMSYEAFEYGYAIAKGWL